MIFKSVDPTPSIPNVSLSEFVMANFDALGDKPAVIDGPSGRALTYAQLASDVRRMAVGLVARGMKKGDVFAVLLPNLPEYATAFLGVVAAGGVVTTLNPLMTAEEIRRQLKDTDAQWLFTFAPLAERAIEAARGTNLREIFSLGEAPGTLPFAALLAKDAPMPKVKIDPFEDLLVLPYSSGTGGLPKGVMLTHRNVIAQICQANAMLQGDSDGRVIAVAPFFHILGMVLILLVWLERGGTIVAMPRFDLEQFLTCIQTYRVKYASLVPPIRSRSTRSSTNMTCPASNGSARAQRLSVRRSKRLAPRASAARLARAGACLKSPAQVAAQG
jgi:acyl-CoA synthetase (AMP-forming)/AMP-acid ligase II